ncbi:hypothetical protein N0V90_002377 [Kalmusia sp. IMI 367209]|nr:hypothetical protein N0V90_002377 [Kalmusia sp. IMI 367209]
MDDDTPGPTIKFKRRKIAHPKRTHLDTKDNLVVAAPQSTGLTPAHSDTAQSPTEDGTSLSLKEILRNRKRPRDRLREAAQRAELTKAQALVHREQDAPKQGLYASRFVAQTGQVVDKDDEQITEYIEARLAEKNHRLYGWPIPPHLAEAVAALAPESTQATLSPPVGSHTFERPAMKSEESGKGDHAEHSYRLAAGQGKLQEIDLGPSASLRNFERTEAAWKKLEGGQLEEEPAGKVRLGRDGKPRRQPKRRNSEDIRRDQMVEAVLREAKLDYFDEEVPSASVPGDTANDEALVEQFRLEFLESIESRQQRKPAAPGAKEAPKGPKLGGSRSARAAMRLQEEQAAKNKR